MSERDNNNLIITDMKKITKKDVLKSKTCSHVLQLLDQDYTYKQAVETVLKNSSIEKSKLEEELNLYI